MATPCRVAFFVMRRRKTYPRKGEGDLTPACDRTTALVTTPRTGGANTITQQHSTATRKILQQRKKYCEKCCNFKKISYFCSLKANRKIVKMRCKTTHFLMLTPATAWVGIFTS